MFDRNYPHRFDSVLNSVADDPTAAPEIRAFARNFLVDHRVSHERARVWTNDFPFSDVAGFLNAIKSHYASNIRSTQDPEFLKRHNRSNVVYGGGTGRSPLPPRNRLVCCLDLTGLHDVLIVMKDRYRQAYLRTIADPYPSSESELSEAVQKWHSRRLEGRPKKDHVGAILKLLRDFTQKGHPYHPVWASLEDRFEGVAEPSRPESWVARVGVWRCFNRNRWLAVLGYPIERSITLLRPSVQDCGLYKHHYPSPREALLSSGGHPMSLDPGRLATVIPEYIHQQIEFGGNDVKENFVGCIQRPVIEDPLRRARVRHNSALVGKYGAALLQWCRD